MANEYREAAHQQMIEAALAAAAAEVLARGWSGLRMRAIAEEVGVSRQTLYTAFTDKHGLARALVAQRVERFLAEHGTEPATRSSVQTSVEDAARAPRAGAATRHRCPNCAYVYDEAAGDPREGRPAGTRPVDIPADWACPDCGVRERQDFAPVGQVTV